MRFGRNLTTFKGMNVEKRSEQERRCQAPGCVTTLSQYNTGMLCFAHSDEAARSTFGRRWSRSSEKEQPFPYRHQSSR